MSEEYEEKDVYVLLDFQGKDTSRLLRQQTVYFRMLNLNEAKPIVEIGDDVYEGTYDDVVGTNVHFQEVENPPPNTNIFEAITPITIQYLLKQTKLLKMKKIGTKPKPVVDRGPTETVNIHIKDDYRVLLEKLEQDKFNIEEYITPDAVVETNSEEELLSDKTDDNEEENRAEKNYRWEESRLPPRQNLEPEWFTSVKENTSGIGDAQSKQEMQKNLVYLKYEKLQKIAEQPARRKILPEVVTNTKYERPLDSLPKNDFILWKNLVMQSVEQQQVNLDINKDKIEDFVDINKSIQAGVIAPSNENPRIFTKTEKQELISFRNFVNISPLMKLVMLQDVVQLEKMSMQKMTAEELNKKEDDGYTSKERYELLKNFKEELEVLIISRLQDAQAEDETLGKLENIRLELSDTEELSDAGFSYSSDDNDNDEQPSDSKCEDESMTTDISESEQQFEDEESNNISDTEVHSALETNIKEEKEHSF